MPLEVQEQAVDPGHHNEWHDHCEFTSASMISALRCSNCGGLVSGDAVHRHQEWHDRVSRVEHFMNERAGVAEEPTLF